MRKLTTILLDVDGTLVDSNDLHAQAWRDAFLNGGFDVPYARVRGLIGMGGDKIVPLVTSLPEGDPRVESLLAARTEIFLSRYLTRVRPLPHAREFLARLGDAGYRRIVATSAQPKEYREILRQAGLESHIDAEATAGDADGSKPDPDIVAAAMDKAGAGPDETVMIGDAPYDVEAAARAGIATIAFRSGGYTDRELHRALAIYDGPGDLLERFASSPLAQGRRI